MKWLISLITDGGIDAWISAIGSFLGSLFAGLISAGVAIWIMRRQLKHQEEMQKRKVLEESLNNYKLVVSNITILLEFLSDIKEPMTSFKNTKDNNYRARSQIIEQKREYIIIILQSFERINESIMDKKIINDYLIIKKNNVRTIDLISNITRPGDIRLDDLIDVIESYNSINMIFTEEVGKLEKMNL